MLDALHELQLQPGHALLQENQRRSISIYLYFNLGLQMRQIWLGQAAWRLKARVNADLMYDGLWDDEAEDNKGDCNYEQELEPVENSKAVKLEWSAFIKGLVEEMDWRKLSVRDTHHILTAMFVFGGGDLNEQCISYGSVEQIIDEVQEESARKTKEQEFSERCTVHFD